MNLQSPRLFFVVLCFMKLCRGQAPSTPHWWELLATTAPDTSDPDLLPFYDDADGESNVCCVCVPFYLCSDNNTIITDGGNTLAPRFGVVSAGQDVETCSDITQLCCRPPNAKVGCQISKTLSPPINPVTPNPNTTTCECIHWEFCAEDLRISDGSSPTTLFEGSTPLQRHSKCPHSFEVCCAFDVDPIDPIESPPTPPAPPAGGACFCVNPGLCGENGLIITDGTGGMDMRALAPDGPPCVPPKLCCREPHVKDLPTRAPPTPATPIDDQRCSGIRNRKGVSVRIGGFVQGESQFGEFPWVGMVLRTYSVAGESMNAFIGGAILINPRVMLTAAHKVANEAVASLTVRVGEWDIETVYEPAPHQVRTVESVVIHPNFNNRTLYHDVALLILTEPVVLQTHIRSICLATSVDEVDQSACVTNGWGEDSFDTGNYQTVMKSVTLPLVPSKRCQAMLRRTRLGQWFQLHPSFICAGGEAGKDACSSDGGGPLACPRRGSTTEYLLVGITAWGIGCGEAGVPGVYASTMADNRWITTEAEKRFPSHSAVKRAVFGRTGGGLTLGGVNLEDQGPRNTTRGETTRCRSDVQDCSPTAAAPLPSVTQPPTTPGTTLWATASTTNVTAAASTTEETPTTKSGRQLLPHRGQRHQQLLDAIRRKLERQRRRAERRERRDWRDRMRN